MAEAKGDLGRRNMALLCVLETKLTDAADVHAAAAECLRQEGLTAEAERFSRRIDDVLPNKDRAARCVVGFMKVEPGTFRLVYIDVRRRAHRFGALHAM